MGSISFTINGILSLLLDCFVFLNLRTRMLKIFFTFAPVKQIKTIIDMKRLIPFVCLMALLLCSSCRGFRSTSALSKINKAIQSEKVYSGNTASCCDELMYAGYTNQILQSNRNFLDSLCNNIGTQQSCALQNSQYVKESFSNMNSSMHQNNTSIFSAKGSQRGLYYQAPNKLK